MAETIDSGVVEVDLGVVQGDDWPDDPIEFAVTTDGTTPLEGFVGSARLQVRATYDATEVLASLDSSELGSPLSVSEDGSTVRLAAAAFSTAGWPVTDTSVAKRSQEPLRWDLEVTLAATAGLDTLVRGGFYVLAQVTRP